MPPIIKKIKTENAEAKPQLAPTPPPNAIRQTKVIKISVAPVVTRKVGSRIGPPPVNKQITVKLLKLYANDAINVVSTKEMIQSVAVYDVLGRLVAEKKNVNATSTVINNVTISKSAYIVKVVLENGAEVSKKIIY